MTKVVFFLPHSVPNHMAYNKTPIGAAQHLSKNASLSARDSYRSRIQNIKNKHNFLYIYIYALINNNHQILT